VEIVCQRLKVSQRRACQVIEQERATQRYLPHGSDAEELLLNRIIEMATQYGRYGYRRITALLQREGGGADMETRGTEGTSKAA